MQDAGKWIVVMGLVLVVVGGIVWGLGRAGYRGLPGDIAYEGERVRIYVPIATSILLSILLTGIIWLVQWLSRR